MKILLIGLTLMTSFTAINSYAKCETDTKAKVNNKYFWIEAMRFSKNASVENNRDFTGSYEADIHEMSGSFQEIYAQDTPWKNSYNNNQGALSYLDEILQNLRGEGDITSRQLVS